MNNGIRTLWVVILMLLSCVAVKAAHDFEVDGICYNKIWGDSVTVGVTRKSYGYEGHVTIPDKVTYNGDTYSVTSICEKAFYYCSGLTGVTIPNSVTSVGDEAFKDCSGLTSVSLPNHITSIKEYTFDGCSSLTGFAIPDAVTSIGEATFRECSALTNITFPCSVDTIGGSAFYKCI